MPTYTFEVEAVQKNPGNLLPDWARDAASWAANGHWILRPVGSSEMSAHLCCTDEHFKKHYKPTDKPEMPPPTYPTQRLPDGSVVRWTDEPSPLVAEAMTAFFAKPSTAQRPSIAVGTFVALVVPRQRESDSFSRGRVLAHERYADMNGTREWYYVRWFDSDGLPDKETVKHTRDELEPIGSEGQRVR